MSQDYLIHYGVKGMRWGVRKDRYKSGSRKRSNAKLKTGSYYRVGKKDMDINDSGVLYVSKNKKDAARYVRNLGPNLIAKVLGTSQTHVQTLQSTNKLKNASERDTIKGLFEFYKSDKKALDLFNKSLESMVIDPDNKGITSSQIEKALKNPTSDQSKKMAWAFSSILGNPAFAKEASRFYDSMRSKNYDAIPDLADKYSGISETPTIIIRPDKVVQISSLEISKDVYKDAKDFVKKAGKLKIADFI